MDDVNYGIFVDRFEENFKLFFEFMTEETLQKYRRICRSFVLSHAKTWDKDNGYQYVKDLEAKTKCLGYVFYNSEADDIVPRLILSKSDPSFGEAELWQIQPENDDFNLLLLAKNMPLYTVGVPVSEKVHKLAEITVYSYGRYDNIERVTKPYLSKEIILSQIPQALAAKVSAYALLDDEGYYFGKFDFVLSLFSFKVILYSGEISVK